MANVGQLGWGAVRNWGWCRIVLVAVLVGLPVVAYFGLIPLVDWSGFPRVVSIQRRILPPMAMAGQSSCGSSAKSSKLPNPVLPSPTR